MTEEKSIDQTIPGGAYLVGGVTVNADGEVIKSNSKTVGDGRSADETETKPLTKMTKAELVAEAERIGVSVTPDSMTNKQIIEAIESDGE